MKIDTTDVSAVWALVEITDAARCLAIHDTEIARLRPHVTWAVLPLGLSISDTLQMLARLPIERDEEAFAWQVEQLQARHERAAEGFALLRMRREGTATIN